MIVSQDAVVGGDARASPVSIMHRLSSSLRAELSGPCSASRALLGLRGVVTALSAVERVDLAAGDVGEPGMLPAVLPCFALSRSTCSNTSATA